MRKRQLSAGEAADLRSRKQLLGLAPHQGVDINTSPPDNIAASLILSLFLGGGAEGCGAGPQGRLRMTQQVLQITPGIRTRS